MNKNIVIVVLLSVIVITVGVLVDLMQLIDFKSIEWNGETIVLVRPIVVNDMSIRYMSMDEELVVRSSSGQELFTIETWWE